MYVLPISYFGPVSYYATLFGADSVVIEACEHYVKQTLRNRCLIATHAGAQTLSINVQKGAQPKIPIREVQLSDHGNWMHQHLYSLATYYGNSPFYEFYIDEIRDVMMHGHDGTLFGLDEALRRKMCELIGFEANVTYSHEWMGGCDFPTLADGDAVHYYQVARDEGRRPFQSDMSIVDLLFNMGPESILVLKQQAERMMLHRHDKQNL